MGMLSDRRRLNRCAWEVESPVQYVCVYGGWVCECVCVRLSLCVSLSACMCACMQVCMCVSACVGLTALLFMHVRETNRERKKGQRHEKEKRQRHTDTYKTEKRQRHILVK